MGLMSTLRSLWTPQEEDKRSALGDFYDFFNFGGHSYPITTMQSTSDGEVITGEHFEEFVSAMYRRNGVVYACMAARMAVFSQARFQFRRRVEGRPGELFGTEALALVESPWPQATTTNLLDRMINDADLAGSAYVARRDTARGERLRRVRPDWVTTVVGLPDEVGPDEVEAAYDEIDAEVLGHIYHPGGRHAGRTPTVMFPEEVAHFAPKPDPLNPWRGMSWLLPIVRETQADNLATVHKSQFFKNAASPNLVVKLDIADRDAFKEWVDLFEEKHRGSANAWRTLFFGAGAEVSRVGSTFREMDYKRTMGVAETRIASAAGLSATIARIAEGLQGSALNAGNYSAARRLDADTTFRELWAKASGALQHVVDTPPGAELWYDENDIPFLQEDEADEAEIRNKNANTIAQLVSVAGFEPASVVDAVTSGDLKRLEHSGLIPVQQHPETVTDDQETDDE